MLIKNGNPGLAKSIRLLINSLSQAFDCARGVESYLYGFDEPYIAESTNETHMDFLASFRLTVSFLDSPSRW